MRNIVHLQPSMQNKRAPSAMHHELQQHTCMSQSLCSQKAKCQKAFCNGPRRLK